MECIYDWTKYSNMCPLCKVIIKQLQVFDPFDPETVAKTFDVPEPKQPELDEAGN